MRPPLTGAAQPALWLVSGRAVGFALTFAIPVVLARSLTPVAFGTYKQLFLIYATLYTLGQLGMAESLYYFLPAEKRGAGPLLANAALVLAASGACLLAVLLGTGDLIARLLSNPALVEHLAPLGLFLFLMLLSSPLEIALICRNRYRSAAAAYALSDACRAGLLILPVLWFPRVGAVMVGAILFAGGRAAATVVLLVRTLRERLRPDAPLLRRQLGYALPFELYVLVAIAQGSYHQYAIAHQFDAAAFAIYSVGCLALPLVDLVGTSAGNVLMVQMGEAIRDGRPGEAAGLWRETVRKLALLLLPLAGLLVVNARDIIELLFTSAYASSVPIFMLCALVLFPLAVPIDSGLRVFAETRTLFVLHLVTLLTVAASLPWLLSWLGIAGGIVSVALSAAVAKGIGLARLGRLMRVPATRVLPWQAIGAVTAVAAAACVPALVTGRALPFPPFIRAAAVSLVYAAAFGAGCAVLRIFRADEIAAARAWIRHLVAAVHLTRATSEGG